MVEIDDGFSPVKVFYESWFRSTEYSKILNAAIFVSFV